VGSFSTAEPLGRNLHPSDIAALVTASSFTDGINTYSSSDPNAHVVQLKADTDATGTLTTAVVVLTVQVGALRSVLEGRRQFTRSWMLSNIRQHPPPICIGFARPHRAPSS
jgi:hypothetical protein